MSRFTSLFLIVITISSFIATLNSVNMLLKSRRDSDFFESDEGSFSGSVSKKTNVVGTKSVPPRKQSRAKPVIPVVKRPLELTTNGAKEKRLFHTAVTANGNPYSKWQCRVMYFWYKHFKDMEGSEMGGFTRVLHSGVPDNLMDEIPTFVVDPLPEGMDKGYVVLNRPWAFVQWLEKAKIEEKYIFMAEPDHVIVKPIPNLATSFSPAAFSFFYIEPSKFESILRRWYPTERGPITNIDPIGNSPVIIKTEELKKIAPVWHNVSIEMKSDPNVDKAFGWVLEMYGYATASAMCGYSHILNRDFMVQPPWDKKIGDSYIIHFTYGMDYTLKGEHMPGKFGEWRFDKRSYSSGAPPKNLTLPPQGVPETVRTLIEMINTATWSLPDWVEGAV